MVDIPTALYAASGVTFLAAFVLSTVNYRKTRGLTNYWLIISVTAFLGAVWSGSFIITDVFGWDIPYIRESQFSLIAASMVGYAVSLMKAAAVDIIAEIV